MSEHTPGPWEAHGEVVYQVGGFGLAYCEGKDAEINARLIAAAPEAVQYLQKMTRHYKNLRDACGLTNDIQDIREAEAVLAKARGEVTS